MTSTTRSVLITGGTKGIGLDVARAFLEAQCDVTVVYEHDDQEARAAFGRDADTVHLVQCDVSDAEAYIAALDKILDRAPLNVLVNNAATMLRKTLLDTSLDEWDRVLDTNLRGYFIGAQAAAKRAIKAGTELTIVNVSSTAEVAVNPSQGAYVVAKGGVRSFTRALAMELARYGIRVNAVAPGSVHTTLNWDRMNDPDIRYSIVSRIPMGRPATTREITNAIMYLASPEASYITGETLIVDGGLTLSSVSTFEPLEP
jgi:glucose 1-dehydrogenase